MAGTTGLEPATSAVTGQRSNQLSYVPKIVFQQLRFISHRIKRFAVFRFLASFYLFAAADSILGFGGHHVDTKVDTKTNTATTEPSLSDVARFGVHDSLCRGAFWGVDPCWPVRYVGAFASEESMRLNGLETAPRGRFESSAIFCSRFRNLIRCAVRHHRLDFQRDRNMRSNKPNKMAWCW